jgi:protocatechuate 3,4-dioxygenase beta subunit
MTSQHTPSRRVLLQQALTLAVATSIPAWGRAASGAMAPTLALTEGPFYPRATPLDHDNDLLHFAGAEGVPDGIALDLGGRVLDLGGRALSGVRVEIWQCDAHGRYHYVDDPRNPGKLDLPFQGYGACTTSADGGYRFRTIKPVPYPGRTAHIHFKLSGPGFSNFTTQMFVRGEPRNAEDGIYQEIRDRKARDALTVALRPGDAPAAKLAATFDLILAADGRSEHPG